VAIIVSDSGDADWACMSRAIVLVKRHDGAIGIVPRDWHRPRG